MPTLADEMEQTAKPVIEVVEGPGSYAILVTGDGLLTVTVKTADGTIINNEQVYNEYCFERSRPTEESFTVTIEATAQEDGKLVSEMATMNYTIHAYILMPAPEIVFKDEYDSVKITISGQSMLDITVTINGEVYISTQTYDWWEDYISPTYDEQEIVVSATAIGGDYFGWLPNTVEATYVLPAMEWPLAEEPVIYENPDDNGVWIEAEGYGIVHLFLDETEVENPYYAERSYEEQVLVFRAYCEGNEGEYLQPSGWVTHTVYVPAVEPPVPMEQTAQPYISLTYLHNEPTVTVEITPIEPSYIYYRIGWFDEGYLSYGDWIEYEAPFNVSGIGRYRVEAYAVAPGKVPSEDYIQEFTINPPKLYDFEEDGIFYLITGNGKVSVTCETADFNTYSGDVVIPATVTHDGVTYMVTGIDDHAFYNCTGLTSVTIGAYVTTIGDDAFYNCSALTSLTLGDYVITVGERAFAYCTALATVKMGSGLAHIGAQAFQGCNALTSITCKAATPPVMASSDCFECYSTATLSVYPAVLDSYRTANYWSQFTTIVGEDRVAPAVGDINGDGNLNIGDITSLINMMLNMR